MTELSPYSSLSSSFRDPCGSLFRKDGILYRRINRDYEDNYVRLMTSGLYDKLCSDHLLVRHTEAAVQLAAPDDRLYMVIRPDEVPFVSYPYEWSFSQLKRAALATLEIQRVALGYDMSLKDASAYNIQFIGTTPVQIDTLSFERYRDGTPWVAYRQFCQHFLAPLALMSARDARLAGLLRIHIDGIPLDLAGKLLPFSSILNPFLFLHIHLHAQFQDRYSGKSIKKTGGRMSKTALLALIDNLESGIKSMKYTLSKTEWSDYYDQTAYSSASLENKKAIVSEFIDRAGAGPVWDMGANTGVFSELASARNRLTVAFDRDHACVEALYRRLASGGGNMILPLVIDLTNPSGAIGWDNRERMSLVERGPARTAMALALVHHLAIGNNLPLKNIAEFFAKICTFLIIEFVPKEDPQSQRLLASRDDIFTGYDKIRFEEEFARYFDLQDSRTVIDSTRTIYLMKRR